MRSWTTILLPKIPKIVNPHHAGNYTVATVLDPRLNLAYYTRSGSSVEHVMEIKDKVEKLYVDQYAPVYAVPEPEVALEDVLEDVPEVPLKDRFSIQSAY